ncbi:unnamed protein product [Microthlaspi erraticum]|uniref:F-box domain-containing protein n=1 Tax=Microthlaspi erraticum TaxID=1685480 RepID=A0A6D2JTK6_9BRAS|nr:unnamed protein product [Microthlaspi erraticum]
MASVTYLPSELVMEIMSRVPGKSVARFRSVSKQFRSLLSDSCLLRLHHTRSRDSLFTVRAVNDIRPLKDVCGGFGHSFDTYTTYYFSVTNKANGLVHEFTLNFYSPRVRMLTCYHQLLCFTCETDIYLCDPLNKELKKLPGSTVSKRCFDESKDNECLVSFGFVDGAKKQYKVVKWPRDLDENRTRRLPSGLITTWKKFDLMFEILNVNILEHGRLKVSGWSRHSRPCPYLLQLSSQVHVNGVIYWTTSDFQIVSFSLEDETFSTLDAKPPCFRGPQETRSFTLSGTHGSLWMIMLDYSVPPSRIMEVWKMEDSGWARIHAVHLGGSHHPADKDLGKVEMLDIGSDQVLFKLSSPSSRGPFIWCYDAKTNTLENYGSMSYDCQLCHSIDGLLSLRDIDMSGSLTPSTKSPSFGSFSDTHIIRKTLSLLMLGRKS